MTDDSMKDLAAEISSSPAQPKEAALERLTKMAADVENIDSEINSLEERLKALNVRKYDILRRDMVDVFDEVGTDVLGRPEYGFDFVVEPFYFIRLPDADKEPERRQEVFQWLEANGYGDIVKFAVTILLGRNEEDLGERITAGLMALFPDLDISSKRDIPWKRYESWLKEQVNLRREQDARSFEIEIPAEEALVPLPKELLGYEVGRVVKMKKRKK